MHVTQQRISIFVICRALKLNHAMQQERSVRITALTSTEWFYTDSLFSDPVLAYINVEAFCWFS